MKVQLILALHVVVIYQFAFGSTNATQKHEDTSQNKTKRGLIEQTHYFGEPVRIRYIHTPAIIQQDASASATGTNFNFNNPKPVVFHNPTAQIKQVDPSSGVATTADTAPKVTVQQVLYEYQQTPHNAVSNVHFNQQLQTSPVVIPESPKQQYVTIPDTIQSPSQTHLAPQLLPQHQQHQAIPQFSAIATPVHHDTLIHHGQGYSKLLYEQIPVVTTVAPPNAQAKLLYANGKITYQPIHVNNNPYPGIVLPVVRPHGLPATTAPYRASGAIPGTQKPFKPSPTAAITYTHHHAHPKSAGAIVKPTVADAPNKRREEEEEDSEEKSAPVREEQEDVEDDSDERSSYEEAEEDDEEDDFKPSYFGKYRFDEEEDDDRDEDGERGHYRYEEDDEDDRDEDGDRKSSSNNSKRVYKKAQHGKKKRVAKPNGGRYSKHDRYKFREGYKSKKHADYTAPSEFHKLQKMPGHYKTYKYYKKSSPTSRSGTVQVFKDGIQGRESENVPVVHHNKVIRHEKWIVTKNASE